MVLPTGCARAAIEASGDSAATRKASDVTTRSRRIVMPSRDRRLLTIRPTHTPPTPKIVEALSDTAGQADRFQRRMTDMKRQDESGYYIWVATSSSFRKNRVSPSSSSTGRAKASEAASPVRCASDIGEEYRNESALLRHGCSSSSFTCATRTAYNLIAWSVYKPGKQACGAMSLWWSIRGT